jgi:hypothetical protein
MEPDMTDQQESKSRELGGGLNEAVLAGANQEGLGGSGGSSGGGTIAGSGEPSGGTLQGGGQTSGAVPADAGAGPAALTGGVAALDPSGIAAEAAALGGADGTLADAAQRAAGQAPHIRGGPVGSEALGGGAGRGDVGSGTPSDKGDLGGGGSS